MERSVFVVKGVDKVAVSRIVDRVLRASPVEFDVSTHRQGENKGRWTMEFALSHPSSESMESFVNHGRQVLQKSSRGCTRGHILKVSQEAPAVA